MATELLRWSHLNSLTYCSVCGVRGQWVDSVWSIWGEFCSTCHADSEYVRNEKRRVFAERVKLQEIAAMVAFGAEQDRALAAKDRLVKAEQEALNPPPPLPPAVGIVLIRYPERTPARKEPARKPQSAKAKAAAARRQRERKAIIATKTRVYLDEPVCLPVPVVSVESVRSARTPDFERDLDRRANTMLAHAPWMRRQRFSRRYEGFSR